MENRENRGCYGQIVDMLARIKEGPEVRGRIMAVVDDTQDPAYSHLLIRTENGQEKYIIQKKVVRDVHAAWFDQVELTGERSFQRGSEFVGHVRGLGVSRRVQRRLDKDPFNRMR